MPSVNTTIAQITKFTRLAANQAPVATRITDAPRLSGRRATSAVGCPAGAGSLTSSDRDHGTGCPSASGPTGAALRVGLLQLAGHHPAVGIRHSLGVRRHWLLHPYILPADRLQ